MRVRQAARVAALVLLVVTISPVLIPRLLESPSHADQQKYLLVTAHPDDESLFWSPAITSWQARRAKSVHILCLSTGNFWGKGSVRQRELIPEDSVHVVDTPGLQDGKNETWQEEEIADLVSQVVREHHVSTVITFDEQGMTGHPNHNATHRGVRQYLQQCVQGFRGSPLDCPAGLQLLTLRPVYKRLGLLSVLPATIEARLRGQYVFVHQALWRSFAAMAAHRTQAHWWSHLLTSPTTLINTMTRIEDGSAGRSGSGSKRRHRLRASYHRRVLRGTPSSRL